MTDSKRPTSAQAADGEKDHQLSQLARTLRKHVIEMVYAAGSGHCGGSLSAAEILAVLYFDQLKIDPRNPLWPERDRFIASKGHCAPALYAVLAERGFFPKAELAHLRKAGHFLQGHPDMKKVPGVDMSTGSLGMGLSVGIGMACSALLDKKDYYVYVLLGCGEQQEGEIWEAAMAAVKFRLTRLIAILDYNHVQLDGRLEEIMPLGDVHAKWRAFGWNTLEIDGHHVGEIRQALERARQYVDRPTIIIARTVKGKGVSFMEGNHEWHGKPLNDADYARALADLEGSA